MNSAATEKRSCKDFQEDYEKTGAILQEKRPYLINLQAKVKTIAEKR